MFDKKLGKSNKGFFGEGWAVKNLLPHISTLEGPSSPSPYKQVIIVKFSDNLLTSNTVFALTLYAATIITYKYNSCLECSVLCKVRIQPYANAP